MSLRIKFVGAAGTVTGSCTLIHSVRSDCYYLVDCGSYVGTAGEEERNKRKFPFDPTRVAAVMLTHAHMDHIGMLPRLMQEGFEGKIYCTSATAKMTLAALRDAVRLDGSTFSGWDVERLGQMFDCPDNKEDFQLGHFYPLERDLLYSFSRNAHITGSVSVALRMNLGPDEKLTVTFSGDIGPCTDGTVYGGLQRERHYPNPDTTYLIAESTYGGRIRPANVSRFDARIAALAKALEEAFARGPNSVVIFPAFTIQRTQELIAELDYVFSHKLVEGVSQDGQEPPTVMVESPLACEQGTTILAELRRRNKKGKRIFLNDKSPLFAGMDGDAIDALLESWLDPEAAARMDGKLWRLCYGRCRSYDADGPLILLTSAGACQGGPVIAHFKTQLTNPQATVVITGYQPSGGLGDRLKKLGSMSLEERAKCVLKVDDVELRGTDVQAAVADLAAYYSGHADEDGLVDYILTDDTGKANAPVTVFLNHGDARARVSLKARLEQESALAKPGRRALREVFLPDASDGWFDVVARQWEAPATSGMSAEQAAELMTLLRELRAGQEEILDLLRRKA